MMDFINNHLNIILVILGVLLVITKIKGIRCFIMLGAESPNPGPREYYMKRFFIYEIVSTIFSTCFCLLLCEWFWLWEVLLGTFGIWFIEIALLYLWFAVIVNLFIWFYDETKIGQVIIEKRHKKIEKYYEEYERTHKEEIEEEKRIIEEWFENEDNRR